MQFTIASRTSPSLRSTLPESPRGRVTKTDDRSGRDAHGQSHGHAGFGHEVLGHECRQVRAATRYPFTSALLVGVFDFFKAGFDDGLGRFFLVEDATILDQNHRIVDDILFFLRR